MEALFTPLRLLGVVSILFGLMGIRFHQSFVKRQMRFVKPKNEKEEHDALKALKFRNYLISYFLILVGIVLTIFE